MESETDLLVRLASMTMKRTKDERKVTTVKWVGVMEKAKDDKRYVITNERDDSLG